MAIPMQSSSSAAAESATLAEVGDDATVSASEVGALRDFGCSISFGKWSTGRLEAFMQQQAVQLLQQQQPFRRLSRIDAVIDNP
jgi:hypothetical protein